MTPIGGEAIMKVVAIIGSYRKGRIIDSAVTEILRGASEAGADTEKIYLTDLHIEFCRNCRDCTQAPGDRPGTCFHQDDMSSIIQACLAADVLILAAPVNMGSATAITKRFLERLTPLAYWPYGQPGPKSRNPVPKPRRAILVSSSAAPALIATLPGSGARPVLKYIAKVFRAKVVKRIHYGLAAFQKNTDLPDKKKRAAFALGASLV
jgi:putative NADPH-quinone reductase